MTEQLRLLETEHDKLEAIQKKIERADETLGHYLLYNAAARKERCELREEFARLTK